MKIKAFVVAITLCLLLSGMMVAVGGEVRDREEGSEETRAKATEINDWYDLNNTRENLEGDYILKSDLDQTTAGYGEEGDDYNTDPKNPDTDNDSLEVWMHPTPFSEPLTELGGNPETWGWVREHVTGVEWNGAMNVVHRDEGGESFIDTLVDADCGIGMSVGGPDRRYKPFDQNFGERAAAEQALLLQGVENLGGQVDHINIDGPVKRVLEGFDWENSTDDPPSVDRIAEELVDYVVTIRAEHGDVTPWIITNFPNWGWKGNGSVTHREWGNYYDVFPVIVEEFHARDVPLEGVMVDHPFEYDGKERLIDLRKEARSRDVKFNMIINSAGGGGRSDVAFSRRTLRYLEELREMDLNPDRYTIQSWYDHPEQNVPESDSSTMTGLTRAVLERLEPTADAGEDQTVAVEDIVDFDGSDSSDNVGIASYEWHFGDGSNPGFGEMTTHTYDEPGTYTVTLNVTDEAGNYDTDSITVNVNDETDPTADAGEDKTVNVDEEITLDASGSSDNTGIDNYHWDLDNGDTRTGEQITYIYDETGTYDVELTVTDEAGNTDTDTITITGEEVDSTDDGEDDKGIPGFTMSILLLAVTTSLAIYRKKKPKS